MLHKTNYLKKPNIKKKEQEELRMINCIVELIYQYTSIVKVNVINFKFHLNDFIV
jgi:hypothetical protein